MWKLSVPYSGTVIKKKVRGTIIERKFVVRSAQVGKIGYWLRGRSSVRKPVTPEVPPWERSSGEQPLHTSRLMLKLFLMYTWASKLSLKI